MFIFIGPNSRWIYKEIDDIEMQYRVQSNNFIIPLEVAEGVKFVTSF